MCIFYYKRKLHICQQVILQYKDTQEIQYKKPAIAAGFSKVQ